MICARRKSARYFGGPSDCPGFIDEVIEILRSSKDQPEGRERLMQRFGLDEPQAQAIVQMRLGQLTGLERHKIEEEMAQLKEKIAEYMEILSSETRVLEIVKEEALVCATNTGMTAVQKLQI